MSRIRKMATAAATFSVALGIGFVMQNGDALAARFGGEPMSPTPGGPVPAATPPRVTVTVEQASVTPAIAPITADSPLALAPPETTDPAATPLIMPVAATDLAPSPLALTAAATSPLTLTPIAPDTAAILPVSTPAAPVPAPLGAALIPVVAPLPLSTPDLTALPGQAAQIAAFLGRSLTPAPLLTPAALELTPVQPDLSDPPAAADECLATLSAVALPMGLADLTLDAPCAPSQAVVLHHEGMRFTILTDLAGQARITVPALTVEAAFIIDLGQGQGAAAQITLPDVATLDRAVLQGHADQGLALHAFAGGAGFGEPGHVWRDAAASDRSAGFLTRLGDNAVEGALMAEVYTLPPGTAGRVDLIVEAQVTAANCGQDLTAQTLQLSPGAAVFAREISLTMPDCAAEGEYLMLPDALFGITVAAN